MNLVNKNFVVNIFILLFNINFIIKNNFIYFNIKKIRAKKEKNIKKYKKNN